MTELTLIRDTVTEDGVFGRLFVGDVELCTVEDDWKNNKPSESCIPEGKYDLKRTQYYHGGYETFWITDVKGRSRILIHRGNTEEDTKGCVLVGTRPGEFWVQDEDDPKHPKVKKRGVANSHMAHDLFMKQMQNVDEAILVVRWGPGLPS
jgi:hypothetical protein